MKKILISITIPDGINPDVIDIGYTTPAGNFESHRVYESEFKELTLPSEKEIFEMMLKDIGVASTLRVKGASWIIKKILNQ